MFQAPNTASSYRAFEEMYPYVEALIFCLRKFSKAELVILIVHFTLRVMGKKSGHLPKDGPQNVCGPQIRKFRLLKKGDKNKPMSLEELSSRVQEIYGVSMSPSQLSKIERKEKHVLDVQLRALALALEIKVCDLFP